MSIKTAKSLRELSKENLLKELESVTSSLNGVMLLPKDKVAEKMKAKSLRQSRARILTIINESSNS